MDINEYVKWTENTCASLETNKDDIVHMLFGMTTEVGELIDIFKKALAYGKVIDWIHVDEELGDLMFYIASFCRINNINLSNIINKNVAKLEERYPEKFTEYHANNRNLEKEREILEKE